MVHSHKSIDRGPDAVQLVQLSVHCMEAPCSCNGRAAHLGSTASIVGWLAGWSPQSLHNNAFVPPILKLMAAAAGLSIRGIFLST